MNKKEQYDFIRIAFFFEKKVLLQKYFVLLQINLLLLCAAKLLETMSVRQEIKINIPASKSVVNRLLIIEKLCRRKIVSKKNISCSDTETLLQSLSLRSKQIDIKNSGTAMRFMTAFLTRKIGTWLLTGSGEMQHRPVETLVNALKTLGADIEYCVKKGFLPLKICTKTLLNPILPLSIENSNSSQTISALMLIAPYFDNGLIINVKNCSSFPYISLTKKIMEYCGAEVKITQKHNLLQCIENSLKRQNDDYRQQLLEIKILPKKYFTEKSLPILREINIENDWDAAAFWFAVAATSEKTKKIVLTNLFSDSYQPNSIVKKIFKNFFGIKFWFIENNLVLEKKENFILPEKFNFDFENYPDLVPIITVTCCLLGIKFNFSGVKNLRIKESNRLYAMQNELKKCGFSL
jgi:3-phosphoshikimate 1-carboxyvinyltransferase